MTHFKRYVPMAFAALTGLSGTALFAETYAVPQGCTPVLTSHSASCGVTINWTCDTGFNGSATFDPDGIQSIFLISSQNALLDAQYMWDESREVIEGEPVDPYSLAMLILNGTDSYEMQISRTDPTGTRSLSLTGTDFLTGETITIGDHTLQEIQFTLNYLEADGSLNYRSEGTQFLLQSPLVLVSGEGQAMDIEGRWDYNETPVELIFPGQPGFAETTPRHGCAAPTPTPAPAPAPTPTPTPAPAPAPTPTPTPAPAPQPSPAPTAPLNTGTGANTDK